MAYEKKEENFLLMLDVIKDYQSRIHITRCFYCRDLFVYSPLIHLERQQAYPLTYVLAHDNNCRYCFQKIWTIFERKGTECDCKRCMRETTCLTCDEVYDHRDSCASECVPCKEKRWIKWGEKAERKKLDEKAKNRARLKTPSPPPTLRKAHHSKARNPLPIERLKKKMKDEDEEDAENDCIVIDLIE